MANQNEIKNFPKVSIVTPFYNEELMIDKYFAEIKKVFAKHLDHIEIVCINDGSHDKTLQKLKKHSQAFNIKIVDLSRNFGKEAALSAGLDNASGDVIIPIDADLQDPIVVVYDMIKEWQSGYLVVNAIRKTRKDNLLKTILSKLYYKVFAYLTNHKIPVEVGDFRLLDRRVVEAIKSCKEVSRYNKGIMSWVGFKTTSIYYDRPERAAGETKFSYWKLLKHGIDGICSFSTKPLKFCFSLGFVISSISFVYGMLIIFRTLIYGIDLPGYASIMVAILFMGGLQLLSLGVIGEYIARIYKEAKNRPLYIVDKIYEDRKSNKKEESARTKS